MSGHEHDQAYHGHDHDHGHPHPHEHDHRGLWTDGFTSLAVHADPLDGADHHAVLQHHAGAA